MKKYKIFFCAILLALTITLISTGQIYALTLFSEDFEGDLSVWTGKAGEVHHGVIVDDPKEWIKLCALMI